MKLPGYQLIIDFWLANKRRLVFIVLATALGTIVSLSFPYLLKLIIDGIKTNLARRELLKYVLILFGLGVVRSLVSVYLPFLRGRTNEIFQWHTRSRLFKHILNMGTTFSNRFPSGDVIERLDQDLGELSWFACSGVFRPIEGIFTIIFALIILIKLNPILTLISVLPVWLAVLVWLKLGPLVYVWYRQWRETMSLTSNHLESTFSGIKVVKSYGVEDFNIKRFAEILKDRIFKAVKVVRAEAKIGIFFSGIAELGILIILWLGGSYVIKGRLTLGEFIAFNAYILMLITPMFDIGNFFVAGRRAKAGEERLSALLNAEPDIRVCAGARLPIAQWHKIEFKDVTFKYQVKDKPVLENINLAIVPNKKIGIAGTVGSGKSTIIRLLLRICEPTRGGVYLDDKPYSDYDLKQLRGLFGYAPQETSLFSDTIQNNIIWGREAYIKNQKSKIKDLTEITQLQKDLQVFAQGIEQQIGERGLALSGGQKQKVSLTRALLTHPQILILDDATANLDAETEQQLIQYLTASDITETLLIISHRLALLSVCDIIYCLDQGKIVEQGTHTGLLAKKGLYYKLYQRQLLEKELT